MEGFGTYVNAAIEFDVAAVAHPVISESKMARPGPCTLR